MFDFAMTSICLLFSKSLGTHFSLMPFLKTLSRGCDSVVAWDSEKQCNRLDWFFRILPQAGMESRLTHTKCLEKAREYHRDAPLSFLQCPSCPIGKWVRKLLSFVFLSSFSILLSNLFVSRLHLATLLVQKSTSSFTTKRRTSWRSRCTMAQNESKLFGRYRKGKWIFWSVRTKL